MNVFLRVGGRVSAIGLLAGCIVASLPTTKPDEPKRYPGWPMMAPLERPAKPAAVPAPLDAWLGAVGAQLATPNPDHDPARDKPARRMATTDGQR